MSAAVEAIRKEFARYQLQMLLPLDSMSPAHPGIGKKNSSAAGQPPIAAQNLLQPAVVSTTGSDEDIGRWI